jgi:hypothetical protein
VTEVVWPPQLGAVAQHHGRVGGGSEIGSSSGQRRREGGSATWAKSEGVPPIVGREGRHAAAESEGVSATTEEDGVAAAESGGQLRPPREMMLSRWRNQEGSSCHHERGGQQCRSATARGRAATQRRSATEEGRNNTKSEREEGGGIGRVGWWSGGCKEE